MLLLTPGSVFGERYEVVRTLSSGGMGVVYEVVDRDTQRHRAMKVMIPQVGWDADARTRFEREGLITAKVQSEHLVEVFDVGVDASTGSPYLVMELLRGEDLGARVRRHVATEPREVMNIVEQVGRGLAKTHALGIVHRDLKPENLFLTDLEDGSTRVKILDFGIAKLVDRSTQATATIGTPLYMAPEQMTGSSKDIGPQTDLYALAQITFTLLVGRPYFGEELGDSGNVVAFVVKAMQGPPEPASRRAERLGVLLPVAFDGWFARATDPAPQRRHGEVRSFVADLRTTLEGATGRLTTVERAPLSIEVGPTQAVTSSATAGTARHLTRRRILGGAAIAGVSLFAGAAVLAVYKLRPRQVPAPPMSKIVSRAKKQRSTLFARLMEIRAEQAWKFTGGKLGEGPQPDASPWVTSQALAALLRCADATEAQLDELVKDLAGITKSRHLAMDGATPLGFKPSTREIHAEPTLWSAAAVAIALGRKEVGAASKQQLEPALQLVERILDLYRADDGGWNMFPRQIDASRHGTYSTALALLALLELSSSGVRWRGGDDTAEAEVRKTSAWLCDHFEPGTENVPGGWRPRPDATGGPADGLSLQIYATLLRAEEQGAPLSKPVVDAMAIQVGRLQSRDVSYPMTSGEYWEDHRGVNGATIKVTAPLGIKFAWHPWAVDFVRRWVARLESKGAPEKSVEDAVRVLAHLVIDLESGVLAFLETESFLVSEHLYTLDFF